MLEIQELCVFLLIGVMLLSAITQGALARASNGPVTLLTDAECWDRMPPADSGGGQPLPSWAKAVAVQLPRTAATMLELDSAQRTKSPWTWCSGPRCAG